jgi:hypothetical protein
MKRFFVFAPWLAWLATVACAGVVYGCGGGSSGTSPSDAGSDGSFADGPKVHEAGGPYDSSGSGGDDSTAASCPTPDDVSKWTPPAYVKATHSPSACSAKALSDFDTACINSSSKSTTACNTYKTSQAGCYACLVSQSTDATWGPLVVDNGSYNINGGGCIQLVDPNSQACAAAQEAFEQCTHAACDKACPVTDSSSFALYQQCATTADNQGCSTFGTAAQSCLASEDASAVVPTCTGPTTFEALFLHIAPVFCGGASDGGAPEGGAAEGGGAEGGADAAGD